MEYHQPKFYRFNEDSFLLISEIKKSELKSISNILDIGAGSGVIGIELANYFESSNTYFLEKQDEFGPYLESNCKKFLTKNYEIKIQSLEDFCPKIKFDLIVSNPPYFQEGRGRCSPDLNKNICRTFSGGMNLEKWIELSLRLLADNGHLYLICHELNFPFVQKFHFVECVKNKEITILKIFNK